MSQTALTSICTFTYLFAFQRFSILPSKAEPRAQPVFPVSAFCRVRDTNSGQLRIPGLPSLRLTEGQVKRSRWRESGVRRAPTRGPTARAVAAPTPRQATRPIRTDVVFLKTHKTASSTFQNILFRFGEKHNLTFAFPVGSYQFRYPAAFMASYVAPLPPGAAGGRFHILSSHMRLNTAEVSRVMARNATYLSIVRRPESAFESVFRYYQTVVPAFIAAKQASGGGADPLRTFLEKPEKFYGSPKRPLAFVKNPTAFDFGLDPNAAVSSKGLRAVLARLDATFDLVMITERFDESVILAKELLGWETEDVVSLSLNKRAKTQGGNNSIERYDARLYEMIRRWNALDVALYEHFLRRFQRQVVAFGAERMRREVDALRGQVRALRQECVAGEVGARKMKQREIRPFVFGAVDIVGYNMRSGLDPATRERCLRLLLPELKYHTRLFQRQYGSTVEKYKSPVVRARERRRNAPRV